MTRQAFGRACVSLFSTAVLTLALAACGGSDEGGDATKSPDLPAPQLQSINFDCMPNPVAAGGVSQCTAQCRIVSVNEDGDELETTGCRNFTCSSANSDIAVVESVDDATDTCVVRGVTEGVVDITGREKDGGKTTELEVGAATAQDFFIEPDAMDLPIGVSQQARAFATFSNNVTSEVTNTTVWTSASMAIATVGNGETDGQGNVISPKGRVRGVAEGNTTVTGSFQNNSFMDTVAVAVRQAVFVADSLCVEPVDSLPTFTCRAFDPVNDACDPGDTEINVNGTAQFAAFGQFDDGTYCHLSSDVDWSLDPEINGASINDSGLVQAGDETGSTDVTATFDAESASAPLSIVSGGRIAANSLEIGIPIQDSDDTDNDGNPGPGDGELNGADVPLQKVFCLGSYDLVMGLEESDDLPAAKQVYANHRFCEDGDGSGDCADEDFGDIATPVNNTVNLVSWRVAGDYFAGGQCVTSSTGAIAGDNPDPAFVGNIEDFNGVETNDPTVKGNTTTFEATGDTPGALRLGTACIEGTLEIPGIEGQSVDGATVIVLPATSDEVLGDAVQLCNTLVPLFLLGGDDSSGAVIQVLTAVSDLLNPALVQLGDAGLDDLVDQILVTVSDTLTSEDTGALSPLLTPILNDVVEDIVDTNVFSPVNCALGALLQGLLGGDPSEIQALAECQPSL